MLTNDIISTICVGQAGVLRPCIRVEIMTITHRLSKAYYCQVNSPNYKCQFQRLSDLSTLISRAVKANIKAICSDTVGPQVSCIDAGPRGT